MPRKKEKSRSPAEVRKAVLGITSYPSDAFSVAPYLKELSESTVWGGVWSRTDKLDLRSRRLLVIAALTALGAHQELEAHVGGALRSGDLTVEELGEAAAHLAVYCGSCRAHYIPSIVLKVSRTLKAEGKPS